MSLRARIVLALAALLGVAGYLVLADLGINAGRVHHGVDVQGFDVGGLNHSDAEKALQERGKDMKRAAMVFTAEGFDCTFTPKMIGWGPQPRDTALEAMAVGREGGIVRAAADRVRAWFGGITVEWSDEPAPERVEAELERCQRDASAVGASIDVDRMRDLIDRMIVSWPREPVPLPLEP